MKHSMILICLERTVLVLIGLVMLQAVTMVAMTLYGFAVALAVTVI